MFLILAKLSIPTPLVASDILVDSQYYCGWSRSISDLNSALWSESDPRGVPLVGAGGGRRREVWRGWVGGRICWKRWRVGPSDLMAAGVFFLASPPRFFLLLHIGGDDMFGSSPGRQ